MLSSKRNLPVFPLVMIIVGVVLTVAAIFWTVNKPSNTVNISPTVAINPPPTAPAARIPFPDVPRMDAAEAKKAFDDGAAIFIDTRGDQYFSQGHIPGALSIIEDELPGRLAEFDTSSWVITYCT